MLASLEPRTHSHYGVTDGVWRRSVRPSRWLCGLGWMLGVALSLLVMEGMVLAQEGGARLRVVSYNVENLFDTSDDPRSADEAFLASGAYHWTEGKYHTKIKQTARVLSDLGEWSYPALVGLVEVENQAVVRDLVDHRSLRSQDYRMAVSRGADPRGIDVALLWHPKHFRQLEAYEIPHYGEPLYYPLRRDPRTRQERSGSGRNSLWVVLEDKKTGEPLDVLVVHLPSRRGGVRASEEKRGRVCAKIHRVLDHIVDQRPTPRIVVMGDFNDTPGDRAVLDSLRTFSAKEAHGDYRNDRLYNLALPLEEEGVGSHYFEQGAWLPDQIMVSGALLDGRQRLHVDTIGQRVFSPEYMSLEGRPKRSFRGTHYSGGGFSDHFPVYIDLIIN